MLPGYREALDGAWAGLLSKDLAAQAGRTGASFDGRRFVLGVLGRRCVVDVVERAITADGREADSLVSIVVLHYLASASAVAPTGRALSYRQLPGGNVFYGAFKRRVVDAVGALFDRAPGPVVEAMKAMGGSNAGGMKFIVPVLPRLPVTVVLWPGDDELPSSAAVLFDETAVSFLHVEDLAEVGAMLADELRERAAQLNPMNRPSSV
jgi:hypothetical protein